MNSDTLVMKFGGASVATPDNFATIADIILDRQSCYKNIIVVVSAMGDTTNELISLARQVHPDPPRREYDMLVTVGERISISLLAMALSLKGVQALSFTGSQSGIITNSDHCDAKIIDVKPGRLCEALERGCVVIVAGFQGVSQCREITTLGRGGSDTTAVALAAALSAEKVEFFKDVLGIYDRDPHGDPSALLYRSMSYRQADEILVKGAGVLHRRSLLLAEMNGVPLQVRSFVVPHDGGTMVYEEGFRRGVPRYENLFNSPCANGEGGGTHSRELLSLLGG